MVVYLGHDVPRTAKEGYSLLPPGTEVIAWFGHEPHVTKSTFSRPRSWHSLAQP
jgi:hypothetical protein